MDLGDEEDRPRTDFGRVRDAIDTGEHVIGYGVALGDRIECFTCLDDVIFLLRSAEHQGHAEKGKQKY
jgi:hypothetical protein